MDDRLLKAAELRLERLYLEAEIERQRPLQSHLRYCVASGLLRVLKHIEVRLEHVLNIETTRSGSDHSGVTL